MAKRSPEDPHLSQPSRRPKITTDEPELTPSMESLGQPSSLPEPATDDRMQVDEMPTASDTDLPDMYEGITVELPDDQFDSNVLSFMENIVMASEVSTKHLRNLFWRILETDSARLRRLTPQETPEFLSKHPRLEEMLLNAWRERRFDTIRKMKLLQAPLQAPISKSSTSAHGITPPWQQALTDATTASWISPYKGRAHIALLKHIQRYNPSTYYAPYLAMAQASGTGKSRTVDELAKTQLVIPICLRPNGSTGYPFSDTQARDFLTGSTSLNEAYYKALFFLTSLMENLNTMFLSQLPKNLPYAAIAAQFRKQMESTRSGAPDNIRQRLFDAVIKRAKELQKNFEDRDQCQSKLSMHPVTPPRPSEPFPSQDKTPEKPSTSKDKTLEQPSTSKDKSLDGSEFDLFRTAYSTVMTRLTESVVPGVTKKNIPMLFLAWDEAHTLAEKEVKDCNGQPTTHFIALRLLLRHLDAQEIFSIFSSTTSKLSQFSPASADDVSSRVIAKQLALFPPFCDLGLDSMVKTRVKVDANPAQCLTDFTTNEFMCHLGRPLFAALYDAGSEVARRNLLGFAESKILGTQVEDTISSIQGIACLSFRIPLQFHLSLYVARPTEMQLVEGHMRICLKIDQSREFMTSISASEPFLAEAAYSITHRHSHEAARNHAIDAFRELTSGFSIHPGDRGEFMALLLLTLARDSTVYSNALKQKSKSDVPRHFKLLDFLTEHLLKPNQIMADVRTQLFNELPEAHLHCNHFIKIHQQCTARRENLLLMIARGAGVLCANCQPGIDCIIPFLIKGLELRLSNLGLILVQVKNDKKFGPSPVQRIFDHMNPIKLDIVTKAVPLIRIVFVLAATPSLNIKCHPPSHDYDAFMVEIWISGLGDTILGPIDKEHKEVWAGLLRASYGWEHLYRQREDNGQLSQNQRRATDAAAADDPRHWDAWAERQGLPD